MVKVVVAHYSENLEWTKNIKYKVIVISKSGIPQDVAPNKGNEASSYLQYIIENYENLDDYTFFVHGEQNSWHHTSDLDVKINNIELIHDYYNINEIQLDTLDHVMGYGHVFDPKLPQSWEIFIKETGIVVDYLNLKCRQAAQFYVKKENILKRPKEDYVKMFHWLMNTDIISFWSSRIFEHSWHFLFTSKLEDRM